MDKQVHQLWERISPFLYVVLSGVTLALFAPALHAQERVELGNAELTLEAFANLTAGLTVDEDNAPQRDRPDARIDGAVRVLGLHRFNDGYQLGARVVVPGSSGYPGQAVEFGERSLLFLAPVGRLELGRSMGLPDVLTGYAPNPFTFTSADYGPPSGPSLDPGEALPTSFLGSPSLAVQIDSISQLGFASSFFNDQSGKLIYVSPKRHGFLGGLSFAPDADDDGDRYGRLAQAGLVHEHYRAHRIVRVGGTYSFAQGREDVAGATRDRHSVSGGATLILDDALSLGAAFTYEGATGLPVVSGASFHSAACGFTASVNYNRGPWTVGGYGQWARAEGDVAVSGDDRLQVFSAGASYRTSTRLRFFAAAYGYRFHDEGGASTAQRYGGIVPIIGTRMTL